VADGLQEEELDKKAAKKAEKARKKEEKKLKKQMTSESEGAEEEEQESGGSKLVIFFVTIVIVAIWLAIFALLIRLDVGGFGSTILQPILQDVPYVNKILPEVAPEEGSEEVVKDPQYPYDNLEAAINRIKELEKELTTAKKSQGKSSDNTAKLEKEIARLQEFEVAQKTFQEEKTKFYEEVVYNDNAPDIEEYRAYYESIDEANAAELYKQVVQDEAADAQVKEYVDSFANMKDKNAAAILEQMTDLKLVARILDNLKVDVRGAILGAMTPAFAAKVTVLMEPEEVPSR
jgi:flagellar motility protein MotE (MotC chaperone)